MQIVLVITLNRVPTNVPYNEKDTVGIYREIDNGNFSKTQILIAYPNLLNSAFTEGRLINFEMT